MGLLTFKRGTLGWGRRVLTCTVWALCLALLGCHAYGPIPLTRAQKTLHGGLEAEELLKSKVLLDRNNNGVGEFAPLSELLSAAQSLGFGELKGPALWRFREDLNEGLYYGEYLVKVFVPSEAELAEGHVCLVAWPLKYRKDWTDVSIVWYLAPEPVSEHDDLWPNVFVGYSTDRRFAGWGAGPKLSDVFKGEPFRSKPDFKRWPPTF